jgi:hypothetical protein
LEALLREAREAARALEREAHNAGRDAESADAYLDE